MNVFTVYNTSTTQSNQPDKLKVLKVLFSVCVWHLSEKQWGKEESWVSGFVITRQAKAQHERSKC